MNLQEIDVFIDPDGQVRLELHGFDDGGEALRAVTEGLQRALGGAVPAREERAEEDADSSGHR